MGAIGKFFKTLWSGIRAFQSIVATVLFLVLVLWIAAALFFTPTPKVPDGGALIVEPVGFLVEEKSQKTAWEIIFQDETRAIPETLLRDLAAAIRHAKTDERITSLVLKMDYLFGASPAQLHYIGQLVNDFKRTGKPVYAYGLGFTNGQYLISSFADEIYMHPMGLVMLTGYGTYPLHYKDALDKIKAEVYVFRAGAYKSLAEPYSRSTMSDETKEANQALLDSLWDDFKAQVWSARGITPEQLMGTYETMSGDLTERGGDLAQLAYDNGFIDGLMTENEWNGFMAEKAGANGGGFGYKGIRFQDYLLATQDDRMNFGGEIAVVTVSGEIILGSSLNGTAGSFTVIQHLETARLDPNVKAVVLRIDSPGGGNLASELIREEILRLKEDGKPVIASMGGVAASGGYYIAAPANEIWAQSTTITGSIGVIGMYPTFERTLDAIGINADGVGTTPLSRDFVFGEGLSPLAKDILQQSVDNSYGRFVQMVAESRNLPPEEVDAVGQGRVWSGKAALEFGLIDSIGNFEDAVASAAILANVSNPQVRFIEPPSDFSNALIEWLFAKTDFEPRLGTPSVSKILLNKLEKTLTALGTFNDPHSVYLLCESCEVSQ